MVSCFQAPSAGWVLELWQGALSLPEGGNEPVYTMAGVLILALGHRLNVLAAE